MEPQDTSSCVLLLSIMIVIIKDRISPAYGSFHMKQNPFISGRFIKNAHMYTPFNKKDHKKGETDAHNTFMFILHLKLYRKSDEDITRYFCRKMPNIKIHTSPNSIYNAM